MTAAADRLEVPDVSVSADGTVFVELTPSQAQGLARILARYDLIVGWCGPDGEQVPIGDDYTPEIWHHTLVRLLAEAQTARLRIGAPPLLVPTVLVPLRRGGTS
jgi:hypothetical protein